VVHSQLEFSEAHEEKMETADRRKTINRTRSRKGTPGGGIFASLQKGGRKEKRNRTRMTPIK